jgi:hypothetical protein
MRPIHAAFAAALIVTCVSGGAVAQAADDERVELSNFDFTPREIHLHAGQATASFSPRRALTQRMRRWLRTVR